MRDRIARFLSEHDDAYERSCVSGHITASAWIVDRTRTHALLTHHRKLDRWLQLGGHVDGDRNPSDAAMREAREESGLVSLRLIVKGIYDLDVHRIPERATEPAHDHYDVRFAFEADAGEPLIVSDESHDLAWVPIGGLAAYGCDESVLRLARKTPLIDRSPDHGAPSANEPGIRTSGVGDRRSETTMNEPVARAQFPDEQSDDGRFLRQGDAFRGWVTADGRSGFPVEAKRYHLYVSWACPWAHRTIIVRRLKGLERAVGMTAVDPIRDARGWAFRDGDDYSRDPINGFVFLREAYVSADPAYHGRVTVPVLWDTKTRGIVSNSDDDIMRMFETEFDAFASPEPICTRRPAVKRSTRSTTSSTKR